VPGVKKEEPSQDLASQGTSDRDRLLLGDPSTLSADMDASTDNGGEDHATT